MLQLSPLNFRGLIATLGLVTKEEPTKPRTRRRAIECWKCPDCREVYNFEDDAEECCEKPAPSTPLTATSCPVCSERYDSARSASDCCLWKDIDAHTRWRMADAVEAGSNWDEQLGLNEKGNRPA